MNSSAFKAFSGLPTPSYQESAINTLAVNRWGDIFALSAGGISYTSMVHKGEHDKGCRTLPIAGDASSLLLLAQMTCIKFNSFGTMLLVWGEGAAGVITLPRTYTLYGGEFQSTNSNDGSSGSTNKGCEFIPLVLPEQCNGKLVKVLWHPYHAEYIVILHQNGPLQMKNVFTGATTTVSLSQSVRYASFSFGPCIGWMAVSVLVLGESGSVFVVCPLLPIGSLLPVEVVVQMAESLSHENDIVSSRVGSDRMKLLKLANLYMSAAFGDLSGDYRAPNNMIRVGGPLVLQSEQAVVAVAGTRVGQHQQQGGVDLSYHQRLLLEILQCPPALQGAVTEVCDLGSNAMKGPKWKGGTTLSPACDITVLPAAPGERGDEDDWSSGDCAPVVVVVWRDGHSKLGILQGQTCPHWDDIATSSTLPLLHDALGGGDEGGSGSGFAIGEDILLRPLPDMVVVECKDAPHHQGQELGQEEQLWSLRSDPVLRHCYHMIAHGSGAAYLVSVRWLADALFTIQQSANRESSSGSGSNGSRNFLTGRDLSNFKDSTNSSDSGTLTASTVIPVFPTLSFVASVSSGHPLSAFTVIHDPTYGHIALFQTSASMASGGNNGGSGSSTSISSVNLTVLLASIAQEQRLLNKMQRTVYTSGDDTLSNTTATTNAVTSSSTHLSIDRDDALHRSASRILQKSDEALQDCTLQLEQHRRDRVADVQPPTVDLSSTWTQLDSDVVTPLEELQQRVNLSVDIVRDVYEAQVEMLSGTSSGSKGGGGGLIRQLDLIRTKQKSIDARMQAIAANLEDEISVCAGIMAFSGYKARELTTGEREFSSEITRCSNVVSRLDAAIQSLEKMQIQRTRLSRSSPRAPLTPPSGMHSRQQQQQLMALSDSNSNPGSRANSPTAASVHIQSKDQTQASLANRGEGLDSNKSSSAELERSFKTMGLKSKVKKEKLDLQLKLQRPPTTMSATSDNISHPVGERVDGVSDGSPDRFGNGTDQPLFGEFNVYSTHTPFVTPMRSRNAEEGTRSATKNSNATSGVLSSFLSPAASTGGARNIRASEPRNTSSAGGHWTVHNFSSTTPHRATGNSKWSINRGGGSDYKGTNKSSPFIPFNKRRQQQPVDGTDETREGTGAKKQTDSRALVTDVAQTPNGNSRASVLDQELLDKLGREGTDIEYLCNEIADVEKRVVELTNAALTLPFGENS